MGDEIATDGGADGGAIGAADDFPTPADRRRHPDIDGTAVEIGGHDWLLADYVPRLGGVWNAIVDQNLLAGRYQFADVRKAAMHLLVENYALGPREAAVLLLAAPMPALVEAVEIAIFGHGVMEKYSSGRTYSQWVRFNFLNNGIDPDSVEPRERRQRNEHLVASGKAPPVEMWVGSAAAVAKRMKADQ